MSAANSTLRDVAPAGDGPLPKLWHRLSVAVLLIIVILGATGALGVHSSTSSVAADGYTLSVTYPATARAGLDVPWRARVHHDDGFPNGLTIAVSTDYFRMFETQGFYPNADTSSNDGRFVYFLFSETPGTDFVLDYDAYIQPSSQIGKAATVELIVDGRVVTSTHIRTWLWP